jgi:hypothetical protein
MNRFSKTFLSVFVVTGLVSATFGTAAADDKKPEGKERPLLTAAKIAKENGGKIVFSNKPIDVSKEKLESKPAFSGDESIYGVLFLKKSTKELTEQGPARFEVSFAATGNYTGADPVRSAMPTDKDSNVFYLDLLPNLANKDVYDKEKAVEYARQLSFVCKHKENQEEKEVKVSLTVSSKKSIIGDGSFLLNCSAARKHISSVLDKLEAKLEKKRR